VDAAELTDLLGVLRRTGGEPATVEVKSGAGGFPPSLRETLVAFANSGGGLVVIGVDESNGFAIVPVHDIARYRDNLVSMASDSITPPLRIATELVEIEEAVVLVADVPSISPDQRPAFVTAKGVSTGAYLRTGDGDRRMNEAEIALVYAQRTQPLYDREVVPGTGRGDLDASAVRRLLERVRVGSPSLRDAADEIALYRLGVLYASAADSPVTLAGLLAFGQYPQHHFPQLIVSVVVHPSESEADARFLDNVTVRGSIPDMVSETLAAVRRNLAARARIDAEGRTDHLDYPLESIREAVVNALLHRDYSPVTRGTQVQLELFPDRLIVRSPGGLYGPISEDDLGESGISSSRNSVLTNLLSDTFLPRTDYLVAENRASGIPTMINQARRHGLPRPMFTSTIASFTATMSRSELLGPGVRQWLSGLGVPLPTPTHEMAMAMMRAGYTTIPALREWGADRIVASQVLRDLVEWGLAVRLGGRRYARYVVDPAIAQGGRAPTLTTSPDVVAGGRQRLAEALREVGEATASSLQSASGLSRSAVQKYLNALIEEGVVVAEGTTRSPRRSYRWIG